MDQRPRITGNENLGLRIRNVSRNFILHIHDSNVFLDSLSPKTTLGLGVILATLFAVQVATGMLLMVHYTPSVESAYFSVKEIIFYIPGGRVFRNIHRWAAHAMVFVLFLHLFTTFYRGSYYGSRRRNWVIGILILLVVMLMSFSGYLLPWDQLAYWAVTIGSNIAASFSELTDLTGVSRYIDPGRLFRKVLLGSDTVGQATLSRFFALHVIVLPAILTGLTGYHFWRIRKDGGLARPSHSAAPPPEEIPTWPTALWAEVAIFLSVIALLLLAGMLIDAPLKTIANPDLPENPAKSPWYLLGIQEIISYSAFMGGFVIPLLFVAFLFYIPWFDTSGERHQGVWFAGRNGLKMTWISVLVGVIITLTFIILFMMTGQPGHRGSTLSVFLNMILNPGTLAVAGYVAWALLVLISTSSKRLTVIALFTAFMTGWTIFMIIGIWFRGENWQLML